MLEGSRVVAHTRLRYPIFQSPMTWIARSPLVSAVSAAGGMGPLESSIADLTVTTREFAAIRAATNQPFGVRRIIDDTIAGFWREIDRLAALRPQGQQRAVGCAARTGLRSLSLHGVKLWRIDVRPRSDFRNGTPMRAC